MWFLLALIALIGAQLVPLPHEVWSALPGREIFAENDRAGGFGELWRALSLAPSRTRNSLFSLAVPLAMLLLLLSIDTSRPQRLLWPVLAMVAVSALLGLLQVLGPKEGPLYLYRITNAGSPVGLFANRNHHAIFLASLFPLLAYVALRLDARAQSRAMVGALCLGAMLFLIPMIIATGSRAGVLLLALSLVLTAGLWLAHYAPSASTRRSPARRRGRWVAAGIALALTAVALLSYFGARSLAFQRLFAEDFDAELRIRLLPQLREMLVNYFPVGTGFGTFDRAYQVIEPFEMLRTNYLNQAHNDALQLVIEGGLPALLLVAGFLIWFGLRGWRAWRDLRDPGAAKGGDVAVQPFAWASLAVLLLGSLFDYPLRTPSLMAFATLLCYLLASAGRPAPRLAG